MNVFLNIIRLKNHCTNFNRYLIYVNFQFKKNYFLFSCIENTRARCIRKHISRSSMIKCDDRETESILLSFKFYNFTVRFFYERRKCVETPFLNFKLLFFKIIHTHQVSYKCYRHIFKGSIVLF